jgi:hypothetical protein
VFQTRLAWRISIVVSGKWISIEKEFVMVLLLGRQEPLITKQPMLERIDRHK